MIYRTKTYIAGDWTGDQDLIGKLYEWNNSDHWALDFHDAHELTQARDASLPCTIKKSLAQRLNASKIFVLVVGCHTNTITKGGCQFCSAYNAYGHYCTHGSNADFRSFIQYECEKAVRDDLQIVVLYNSYKINRANCPSVLRNKGIHLYAYDCNTDWKKIWRYQEIKRAMMGR